MVHLFAFQAGGNSHLFHRAHFGALCLDVIFQILSQSGLFLHFRRVEHVLQDYCHLHEHRHVVLLRTCAAAALQALIYQVGLMLQM